MNSGFKVGDWFVFPDECRIRNAGGDLHLRPQLMDVLVMLATRAGTVVSKDDLLERVWKRQFVSESSLTRSIAELRAHLGDTSAPPAIIETIPKRGYRLVAPVEPCGAAPKPCVAVLSFEALGSTRDAAALAEGLTEAIVTQLGKARCLRTISRQSTLHLRGTPVAIDEVARELGADALVTGTVQQAGTRVRISAQLVRPVPEEQLWAESYESATDDTLGLEQRLSATISGAVTAALVPGAPVPRPPASEPVPSAWVSYVRARAAEGATSPEAFRADLANLRGAIAANPMFAPAYDELASTLASMGFWGYAPPRQAFADAEEAATIALGLDQSLSSGHTAVALVRWLRDRDFAGCDAELQQALALNPANERAHLTSALFHATVTRDRELTERHLRAALEAESVSPLATSLAAWIHLFLGDDERAASQARHANAQNPHLLHGHYVLGWVDGRRGRWREAVGHMERAARISRDAVSLAYLGHALARDGQRDAARQLLDETRARQSAEYVPNYCRVVLHTGLGEADQAFEWLDRACVEHESRVFWFPLTPASDAVRGDPRFDAFVARLGLGGAPLRHT